MTAFPSRQMLSSLGAGQLPGGESHGSRPAFSIPTSAAAATARTEPFPAVAAPLGRGEVGPW